MKTTPTADFSKFVPGFDFLQKLAGASAPAGAPSVSSWVAPTLDPKELERRIQDLKTVQFWLEQNTQAVAATIQALEVQRMTLATLQGMNVSMGHLAEALQVKPAADPAPDAVEPGPAATRARAKRPRQAGEQASAASASSEGAGAIDPMAWWGSLTQQFQQIAGEAMKDMQDKAQKMAAAQTPPTAKSPTQSRRTTGPTARKTSAPKGQKKT